MLKSRHGLGHGNANLLSVRARELLAGGPASADDLLDAQYAGSKAHLRPVYDRLVTVGRAPGDDVEVVIQKTAVSLRRRKQFAVAKPASAKRIELGLNLPPTPADERVTETSGMCSHRLHVTATGEIDDAVTGWLRDAYEAAS